MKFALLFQLIGILIGPYTSIHINLVKHSSMFSCSLAEALDMQPPVMPDDGHTTRVTTGTELPPLKDFSAVEPIWDDEDSKAFYESLPDLRFFLGFDHILLPSTMYRT
jgi:hypothetical protein